MHIYKLNMEINMSNRRITLENIKDKAQSFVARRDININNSKMVLPKINRFYFSMLLCTIIITALILHCNC